MDISAASPLLGGLSPRRFMRRHWQKKPLLARQAVPGGATLIERRALFDLAARDGVESRLVVREGARWSLRPGPIARRALPPLVQPGWTLLVQGVDLHVAAARALLERFRFVPDARVDDLMLSYASDGGGVGAHVDSYDVFLLQLQGRRRWRVGRVREPALVEGVPLKLLANFEPEHDWLLEPGDMLYLPPGWGHDGVAEGECVTASIGFRAAGRDELAREVLQRLVDAGDHDVAGALYRDPAQRATDAPGRIPEALAAFAGEAIKRLLREPDALACALGEVLSEPKRGTWFEPAAVPLAAQSQGTARGVALDPRTRLLYDERHVFINGEAFRAAGRDARLIQRLADARTLAQGDVARLSLDARALLDDWVAAGWAQRRDDE